MDKRRKQAGPMVIECLSEDYQAGPSARIRDKTREMENVLINEGWVRVVEKLDSYRRFATNDDTLSFGEARIIYDHAATLLAKNQEGVNGTVYALCWLLCGLPWPAAHKLTRECKAVLRSNLFDDRGRLTRKALDVPIDVILEVGNGVIDVADIIMGQPDDPDDVQSN